MRITGLNVYPIKGCRGIAVESIGVDGFGLVGDRRLMLVDDDDLFISQREVVALATVVPRVDQGVLFAEAPIQVPLRLSINPDGPAREVRVWDNRKIISADQGDAAAQWFSAAIGTSCRLVAFGSRAHNLVDPEYSSRRDAETAFTDGYPIMATLQESLDSLNSRLAVPVSMERFRPSVVISGASAWSEDDWMVMKIGSIDCDAVKPCARCVVTTTDQVTGARDARQEPLRTLATFRTIPALGAIFGQNIIPRSAGTLRLGDSVEVM